MKNHNCKSQASRMIISILLTLVLIIGMVPFMEPVEAASSGSVFGGTGYSSYNHNKAFDGDLIVNGVDVSVYQSTKSNWETAKKKGVDYAIMRVTWSGYNKIFHSYRNIDSNFATHYSKAKSAGLMTGAYVFSQAKTENEAANEALFAIQRLKELGITPDKLDMPVYMDYEFAGPKVLGRLYGISRTNATKCAKAFCEVIRNAGYKPGIYASTSFYKSYINAGSLGSDVDFWVAQYWHTNTYGGKYSKWQYSSKAEISGILSSNTGKTGKVDVNFWYVDRTVPGTSSFRIVGKPNAAYTGGAVLPELKVYNGSRLLREGTDYTISGFNNIAAGTNKAYAYIRGIKSYDGYAVIPFSINGTYTGTGEQDLSGVAANYLTYAKPASVAVYGTSISKLTRKRKGFTVRVSGKSKAYVTGYQVRYSKNSSMKNAEIRTIGTSYSKVSRKISKLAAGKRYYVQVRSYKVVNGKRYYSGWSTRKSVRTR